ncbi:MAG: IS5 family transposase [Deltaproteobacteria bacterium]|nr:IS5 family transposase [Deltaproteobacteria bacterium]
MRGHESKQATMFSLQLPEQRVPPKHPLRAIKVHAEKVLKRLSPVFDAMYAERGRPSIPPETLLKSSLLIALYSVRSERLFCEQLEYNLLYRWFLDMDMVEPVFDHSTFSANRERLLAHEVANLFFAEVVQLAKEKRLLSNEHFTVDGTLIEAWASLKSFKKKDEKPGNPPDDPGNPTVNFHGEKRSNETHESTTDPDAKLARKGDGKEAKLSYVGHALMENRNGLLVDLQLTQASGTAERDAAKSMLNGLPGARRVTVGADKNYDTKGFVAACREIRVTPHVAQFITARRRSAIDARTTAPPGYAISQRVRKRIEEIWGWMKTVGGMGKTRYRGEKRVAMQTLLTGAAYNLVRIAKLAPV